MQTPMIINADNVLTFLRPYGKSLNLKINEVIRAEVLNILESGDVALRIQQKSGESTIITARSDVVLTKGDTVQLRVSASGAEIKLQFMGTASDGNKMVEKAGEELLPQKVLRMLSEFAGSRLKKEDLVILEELFKAIPDRIKTSFPDVWALEKALPEITKLSSEALKRSVEDTGILFETKLKLAAQEQSLNGNDSVMKGLVDGSDQKMQLLKLRESLHNAELANALQRAGIKPAEVEAMVDKLVKNLEFFQLTSKINEAIYTFLPVTWQELREGELSFRKGRDSGGESYSCDINLDLYPAGRLSVSITMFEDNYYVSFYAEDQAIKDLISDNRGLLEQRFQDGGLRLRAVNIAQKQEISFGAGSAKGLNIKV